MGNAEGMPPADDNRRSGSTAAPGEAQESSGASLSVSREGSLATGVAAPTEVAAAAPTDTAVAPTEAAAATGTAGSHDTAWTIATVALLLAIGAASATVSRLWPNVPVLLVAVGLGIALRSFGLIPAAAERGLAITARRVLRIGVVVLGLRLSWSQMASLGVGPIVVLVATVAITFAATAWLGGRIGVGRRLSLLVATGFSICGAAAVAAMSAVLPPSMGAVRGASGRTAAARPTADASDDVATDPEPELDGEQDVPTAIALVTLFGTVMIGVVPLVAHLTGLADRTAGLWAGTSIHEVAQVVAAGGAISEAALAVAIIAKLGRVVLLAPIVAITGVVVRRRAARAEGGAAGSAAGGRRPAPIPLFVVGFLVAVVLRSTDVVPAGWVPTATWISSAALAAAMVALGAQVKIAHLVRTGGRAVLLGLCSTVIAAVVSIGGLLLVR